MEEYRMREKKRREQAKKNGGTNQFIKMTNDYDDAKTSSPKVTENHREPLRCENMNVMQPTNHRKLCRKHYFEPQKIGNGHKPSSQSDLRRKRAQYFENLLSMN